MAYELAEAAQRRLRFACRDCKIDTLSEYYMVHDETWGHVGDARDDLLCIGCLERRLGRRLYAEDFTQAPINRPAYSWDDSRGG